MKRIFPLFAVSLVLCLLTLSTILTAQSVEHRQHHSQHHQGTHSTPLCTWFCAAGQTLETHRMLVDGPVESLLRFEDWRPISPQVLFIIPPASRAPPPYV